MSGLSCGIVGLPNVGKSSLFNALTANEAASSNYPFCTIDPNVGIVEMHDPRLEVLAKMYKSKQIIYAPVEFVDIAGLVAGAAKGEGLGNQFLTHIREVDAMVHVVRCFEEEKVVHVMGPVDPIRDIEIVNVELLLKDLETVEKIVNRLEREVKREKEKEKEYHTIKRLFQHLNEDKPARSFVGSKEELEIVSSYSLLTMKKVLYVANVSEDDLANNSSKYGDQVTEYAKKENSLCLWVSTKLEQEVAQLEEEEKIQYLQEIGLEQSCLQRLIKESFNLLGLRTFLTAGEKEARAWTIKAGMTAPEAAGRIHTDIQKGFIRAEVIAYNDMEKYGDRNAVKEAGKIKLVGADYVVNDGDVMLFMHQL